MASQWQIDALRARVTSLREEIQRIAEKDHPYHEPETAFCALLNVIDHRHQKFEETIRFSPNEASKHTDFETLSHEIENIWQVFSLVDRVDSSRIPFELLRSVAWTANEILGGQHRIVVRLDPLYNYSLLSLSQKFAENRWQEHWLAAIESTQFRGSSLLLLGFPSAEADSILLHALVAHELGHVFLQRFSHELHLDIVECEALCRGSHQSELAAVVDELALTMHKLVVTGVPIHDVHQHMANRVEAGVSRILRDWSSEIFADLFAAKLLGPAYIAALDRVVMSDSWMPTADHPGIAFRRAIISEFLQAEYPRLCSDTVWVKTVDSIRPPSPDTPVALYAEAVCRELPRKLSKYLTGVSSPLVRLEAAGDADILDVIDDHLLNLAPPSAVLTGEWRSPEAFWLLLFSAWRFRLNEGQFSRFRGKFGWETDENAAEEALNNVLLHSLQTLELAYGWARRQQEHP